MNTEQIRKETKQNQRKGKERIRNSSGSPLTVKFKAPGPVGSRLSLPLSYDMI